VRAAFRDELSAGRHGKPTPTSLDASQRQGLASRTEQVLAMVAAHEVKKVQEFLIKPEEAWFAELQQPKILPKG